METDAAALTPGYVNRRPTGRRAPEQAAGHADLAADAGGHRSAMRIARVALRAYEQRAQRREQLRAWLALRAAAASRS